MAQNLTPYTVTVNLNGKKAPAPDPPPQLDSYTRYVDGRPVETPWPWTKEGRVLSAANAGRIGKALRLLRKATRRVTKAKKLLAKNVRLFAKLRRTQKAAAATAKPTNGTQPAGPDARPADDGDGTLLPGTKKELAKASARCQKALGHFARALAAKGKALAQLKAVMTSAADTGADQKADAEAYIELARWLGLDP